MIYWSNFLALGPKFPMKPFREGHKVLHEGSCNNQELPFQIWRDSNYFCSHNLLKGPFLGAFRYPIIAPISWFLYFLSLTSWSFPNIKFELLWPILVSNFFQNYQKMTIFDMFPFYHVTSNSHISAFFWNMEWNFWGNL